VKLITLETHLRMRAIAIGFGGGVAAAAEGGFGQAVEGSASAAHHFQVALDEKRAIGRCRNVERAIART
jgi:hypothetical protein